MSLRWRITLYGTIVFAILSIILLTWFYHQPILFIICEFLLVLLGVFGFRLLDQLFKPMELLTESTRRLSEQEFTTRLSLLGHQESDQLIEVYNRMIETLRQQRIQNQEQEYFLKKILASTPSAIITFDFDERIVEANPAALEFLESSFGTIQGKKLDEIKQPLAQKLAALPMNTSLILPFRGQRRLKCTRSSYLDKGFAKTYIFMDELTHELRRTEKDAYEKVIRVMTHEINNSLGAAHSLLHSCLNYAPQIQREDRGDFRHALEVIISRTEHLKTFVGDYASVVKLPQPKHSAGDLLGLLQHVQLLLSAELQQRQITWKWDVHPLPDISMDRLQMEQVFLNIAKNAMEAIDTNGRIQVTLQKDQDRPCFVMEDSGGGISSETKEHLFTPFYTTKPSGAGIGLTLVAEILNNHGFDFALESQPFEPTRFKIWF